MALLVPEVIRVTGIGLVRARTDHYGLPRRLADYRRQFERTVRQDGEDPLEFALALETLAVKAFGDMSLIVRICLSCDQFIAGVIGSDVPWLECSACNALTWVITVTE